MEKKVTLSQSLDNSQSSTHSARLATAPGEGDVYNWGVTRSSHAWPANVMVGTSWAATIERAELDVRSINHKRVDAMLVDETCETFGGNCESLRNNAGGNGAVSINGQDQCQVRTILKIEDEACKTCENV